MMISKPTAPSLAADPILMVAVLAIATLAQSPARAAPYSQRHSYLGDQPLDQFGYAVAAAGDVNGDGLQDFLVGANVNDDGAPGGGKAYLYLGGGEYPSAATWTLAGSLELGYLGGALSGGGDLNADGFDDWIVGAPGSGPTGGHPGRAYVFLGGANPDFLADLVLEGEAPGGQFGAAVIVIPDLDGDGHADLAVGAPRDGAGAVFLYRGVTLDAVPDRVLRARPPDRRFGKALAFLPDGNGDACDELLVGVPQSSEIATWAGAVLCYRGRPDLDLAVDLVLGGQSAGDEFGSSLAVGGDVDGDGEPDLVIGAPLANAAGHVDAGKTYLFRAGAAWNAGHDLLLRGSAPGDWFGTAVTLGCDWDGDGASDLVVGIPGSNTNGSNSGALHVYRGGAALDATADIIVPGPVAGMHLGRALAFLGEVRPDGRGCVIAGGYHNNPGRGFLYGAESDATHVAPSPRGSPRVATRPNPFRDITEIHFSLPEPARARIAIHDAAGRVIRTFVSSARRFRAHRVVWDGRTDRGGIVASGVYFVRLETATGTVAAKVTRVGDR